MSASLNTRWSAESVSIIKTLAGEGYTAADIAPKFGVSRNAIIGVCFRNKVKLPGLTRVRWQQRRKEARQRQTAPLAVIAAPPPAEGILVHELTNHTCRWPVHTALPGRYCGAHTDAGSYCEHHHARAYRGLA
jgi:hypothetical protein